jgi:LysR family glycine cleavage system transcriptional activator
MSRKLPPLNALRAFEVSARLGSVALAATELRVTAGAVSQHIRKLEDFFGRPLFIRRNNQLLLTEVGQTVYAVSTELVDALAAVTQNLIQNEDRSSFVVSVLPSVGTRWLVQRVPDFLVHYPEVRIDLRLEEDPVDFFRSRIDVRISYGEHLYPEFVTVPFLRDSVTVLCTSSLAADRGLVVASPDMLRDEDLIHIDWRVGFSAYPTWDTWFHAAGVERHVRRDRGHKTDTVGLALGLAARGAGLVLGQRWLAEEELHSGTLVAPFTTRLDLPYRYCTVHTRANERNPTIRAFIEWINQACSPR